MKPAASRMDSLSTTFFATLGPRLAALKQAGVDVIRLDEGSPDLPPPPPIIEALQKAACRPGANTYQSHRGTPELRQAWAALYRRQHGVTLDAEREIVPLLGSKEGVFHFTQAFVEPGDVVLVPDPGYLTYTRAALFAGGTPYFMPLLPQNHFLPDLEAIPEEIARRAKLLWLNYPNNPTGAVAPARFLAQAVEFAQRYNLLLCHDAAYSQVTFEGYHAASVLEIPGVQEVAVEFNSLSKSHNLAGWRLGALVGSAAALDIFYTLKTNVDSGHFLPVMAGAVQALNGDQGWLVERNEVYRRRRDVLMGGLYGVGLLPAVPQASLYIWCPVPAGWNCEEFTSFLLDEAGVSLTPGTIFGAHGEGYVRISLTAPEERLAEAAARITRLFPFVKKES